MPVWGMGIYILHFLYLFILKGHLGCFHVFVIINSAALKNMGVQIFLGYPDLLDIYLVNL